MPYALPLITCAAVLVGCAIRLDVSAFDMLRFLTVQLVCYALPGTLVWRLLWREPSSWATDAVFGTILGHALTLPFYLLCRAGGAPRLVLLLPLVVVVICFLVPDLRTCWRSEAAAPWPLWYAWTVSAGVSLVSMWFAFCTTLPPVSGPGIVWQGEDSPYALALAAELKNHFPPAVPYVTGQPLHYHWFFFADAAATNWQSGVELDVLTFRLIPLLCLAMSFAAVAALGTSVARRFSVGAATLWLSVLVGSVNPFGWLPSDGLADNTLLSVNWVNSPTQAFGQMLCMPTVLVAIRALRRADNRSMALFVLLSAALMGAKATFIPVLGGGVLLVLLWRLLTRQRNRAVTVALGLVLAAELIFAQLVMFGGASQGTSLAVGSTFRRMIVAYGFAANTAAAGGLPLFLTASIVLGGWLLPLVGAAALLRKAGHREESGGSPPAEGTRDDPAVWLLVGAVLVSIVAASVFSQPGWSQLFFLRSGLPFGYVLAGWGLVVLCARLPGRARLPVLAQAVVVLAVGAILRASTPHPPSGSTPAVALKLILVLGASVLLVLLLALGCSRLPSMSKVRATALLACLGLGFPALGALRSIQIVTDAPVPTPVYSARLPRDQAIPDGGVAAARYVRDHSNPDDMIATNAHCRTPVTRGCDSRNHWLAAWAERREVVAGWGYTATSNEGAANLVAAVYGPFWDKPLLALNDNVFVHPGRDSLLALTSRFPVHWLVVDTRFAARTSELDRLLPDHHRFGATVVYHAPK